MKAAYRVCAQGANCYSVGLPLRLPYYRGLRSALKLRFTIRAVSLVADLSQVQFQCRRFVIQNQKRLWSKSRTAIQESRSLEQIHLR